ncbi:MAG: ATP-binding protein [Candidatus Zixiibacteriota bacterium]
MADYFGRTCALERRPSTVDEFSFWLARGSSEKVEVGYIVTAVNRETKERVFGLVTKIEFFTDAESVLVDYLSHEFGNPSATPPTERQEIHIATAAVIGSDPSRARPMACGIVRLATPDEIHLAYGMDQIDKKVFCGVVTNGPNPDNWAPAFMDEKFLLGPEGAHINISGASGLATKTSAAIFLISSILSSARHTGKRYAVVAFNVKGGDLLQLDSGGEDNRYSQDELLDLIKSYGSADVRKMLSLAQESGVDPCFARSMLHIYAPAKANDIKTPNSLLPEVAKPFYWSLADVLREDAPVRLSDLFEADDLDDKSIGVLNKMEDLLEDENHWGGGKVTSFKELVQRMSTSLREKRFWDPHHHSTVSKVLRLVRSNCEGLLNGLFAYDEESGRDIQIEQVSGGEMWVIDIEAINDRAKRLVFHNITTRLTDLMEKEFLKPREDRRLHGIIVFVDELNKFAPSGALTRSRIKQQILELAARGRSLGVILFGAEQFASRVDKEVIGNSSSHLLGRTEIVELEDRAYGWLPKNLRFIVGSLQKGRLLLRHAPYGRPVFVKFPQPLYNYATVVIEDLLASTPKRTPKSAEVEAKDSDFERLLRILKGKKGIHPIKIYSDVPGVKDLGFGQDTFSVWYHCWMAQRKFKGRGKTERLAFQKVLQFYTPGN